jgi:hypothetical protein
MDGLQPLIKPQPKEKRRKKSSAGFDFFPFPYVKILKKKNLSGYYTSHDDELV